jgi:type IV pilus assembly protein PilP
MRRAEIAPLLALLGAVAIGCGDGKKAAPVPDSAKKPELAGRAGTPDAGTLIAVPYVYAYNPIGKRDPFRSLIDEIRAPAADSALCKEPLCQWTLEQLTLVGVVTGDANPVAMVEDPQGRGYVVHRNTRVGKVGGKVSQIFRDTVTVVELWTGPDGKMSPNPVTLRLKADKSYTPILDLESGKQY